MAMVRENSSSAGAKDEDDQGSVLRGASFLQFLHHVSSSRPSVSAILADKVRLLFMTYNGWIMLSVAVGAFIGHLAFGSDSSSKTVACH
jgi:Ctr copper transporter family